MCWLTSCIGIWDQCFSWGQKSLNDLKNMTITTGTLKPITSDSLCIHAYKYYATMGRQHIADKLARKRFFSTKTDPAQKNYPLIRVLCDRSVCLLGYNSLKGTTPQVGIEWPCKWGPCRYPKWSKQPFAGAIVHRSGFYALS